MNSSQERAGIAFLVAVILAFGSISLQHINPRTQLAQTVSSITDGLIAYYSFENGSAADGSGNGYNGTISGATPVAGKVGGAMNFDGVASQITIGTDFLKTSPYTFSAWVYPRGYGENNRGMLFNNVKTGLRMNFYGTNYQFSNDTFSTSKASASNSTVFNTWQYVTVTRDASGTVNFYINGVQSGTPNQSAGANQAGTTMVLGNEGTYARHFDGMLDEVRFYNRVLLTSEIQQLYALATPSDPISGTTPPQTEPPPATNPPPESTVEQPLSGPGTYYVSPGGSDNAAGSQSSPWKTIQKCASTVPAGSTCSVKSGVYQEHVDTARGGTSDSNRITFKADGLVTMTGFDIKHPYVTVDGFTMTGNPGRGYVVITSDGDYCQILNNTITGIFSGVGTPPITSIEFYSSGGISADNCVLRGNKISNASYTVMSVVGNNHTIENNEMWAANGFDFFRLFGQGHVIRNNIMRDSTLVSGIGNHPDIFQVFAGFDEATVSRNILIERNFSTNLIGYQLSQLTIVKTHAPDSPRSQNIRDWSFKNNVFAGIELGGTMNIPELKWYNNTFYKNNYGIGSNIINMGEFSANNLIKNNTFVANGDGSASRGWYSGTQLTTLTANYNHVAGLPPTYAPKQARTQYCSGGTPALYDFCELQGRNGGDPKFQNINDPLGPDGRPWTSDDGLKPLAGSVLCGAGEGGIDIGAYTCPEGSLATRPGDINGDGRVNTFDFSEMNNVWNKSDSRCDLNKDSIVNTLDYSILVRNWTG